MCVLSSILKKFETPSNFLIEPFAGNQTILYLRVNTLQTDGMCVCIFVFLDDVKFRVAQEI